MATLITGPDPLAPSWPIPLVPTKALSRPTGYTTTGVGEPAVIASLADANDATYVQQQYADSYWRYQCASYALPAGARVTSVTPSVRARMVASNVRNDWLVFQGDHSGAKYAAADHIPAAHYPVSSQPMRNYSGPAATTLANKQLITQADLERGLFVVFGLNTVYGKSAANATVRVAEAKLQMTYDLPPTAVVTGPVPGGTISDTASPLVTWDYSDDFQPQSAYTVDLTDATGVTVYSSGLVKTSDTSHQVKVNLPNGAYTARVRVYQNWAGPGGLFASLAAATGTFTVAVLRLAPPRLSSTVTVEQAKVTVYPDVNLLNFDDSSFDRGYLPLSTAPVNCTVSAATAPVLNGTGSIKVTVTAAGSVVASRPGVVSCTGLDQFNALVYVNPAALAGRSAQLRMSFRDATGAVLSTVNGTVTAMAANAWTPLTLINATAPLSSVALSYSVAFTGTTNGDAYYLDNAAVWHGGGQNRTNLCTAPSFETGAAPGYVAGGNVQPVLSVINTDAYVGTQSLKVTSAGANNFFPCVALPSFATVVGQVYTVSVRVKLPTAGGVAGTFILADTAGAGTFGTGVTAVDQWLTAWVTFVATAVTHTVKVGFNGTSAAGQFFLLDAVLFEQTDSALTYFDGSSPGASWSGAANASTSTLLSSFPVWSRGGFFENTPNLLAYDDSSLEGDSYVWAPATNCTVAASATAGVHGARSLLQSAVAATVSMAAQLGTSRFYPCTAGETLWLHAASKAVTTARPFSVALAFFSAAGAALGQQAVTGNNLTTGWVIVSGGVVAPAGAVSFQVLLQVAPAAGTLAVGEGHLWDALAVYRATFYQGYVPGYLPNTDDAPTVVVEYQDAGSTAWQELDRKLASSAASSLTFYDYTARSGTQRTYRAYLVETENDVLLTSDYSSLSSVLVNLCGVWIAAATDPVGTSRHFSFDGNGRTQLVGARPALTDLSGRGYPFAEFGDDYEGTVGVSLQLTYGSDQANLVALSLIKSEVIFRDQRGRSVRGVMGTVSYTDEIWGQTAAFTLSQTGTQP